MDKQTIMAMAANNPQVAQAADVIEARISNMPGITEQMIDQLVATLEYVLQNPQEYPQVRQAAIRAGFGSEQDFPAEFDPVLIVSMLVALYEVQARYQSGQSQAFARGGLARAAREVAAAGRGGDTMLAHINPREASMLARMGGAGTVNPMTGLVEFKGGVGKLIAAVAPVVLSIVAPGIGTAIGGALGATGAAASALGGAVIGGASSALAGGDPLKGALGGAIGAGGAQALGGAVNSALGTSLGTTAQNVVGSTLAGAAQGALSGQGATAGALQGALGGSIGSSLSGMASGIGGGLGAGLQTAGTQFGNALTMGATPQEAALQGGLAGLASGMTYKNPLYDITPSETGGLGLKAPSDLAVDSLATPGAVDYSLAPAPAPSPMASSEPVSPLAQLATAEPALGSGITAPANMGTTLTPGEGWTPGTATDAFSIQEAAPTSAQPELGTGIQASPLNQIAAQTSAAMPTAQSTSTGAGNKLGLGSMSSAASMLPLLSLFSAAQTPEEVQQVVAQMTPEQQEYFNRPMRTWNWDTLNAAAKMQGLPIGSYIARNWDKVGGGAYDNPVEQTQEYESGGIVEKKFNLNNLLDLGFNNGFGVPNMLNNHLLKNGFDLSEEGKLTDKGTGAEVSILKALEMRQDPLRKKLYDGAEASINPQLKQTFDWEKINDLAKQSGISPSQFLSRNWGGSIPTIQMASGGVLTRLARGGGSGRDDTIPARLSDGEYVMDAETVALLGDGSTDAGARRLDQMRAKIRQHKGKSMARGKFSANAKSPLSYLKEAR